MNVCILSNIGNNIDEGQKNVAFHLARELSKKNTVFHVNAKKGILSFKFWQDLDEFEPQIIHIFLRLTFTTALLVKMIRLKCRYAKIILNALQPPPYLKYLKYFIPFLKTNLVCVLSEETEQIFNHLGCKTAFLISCGVDVQKFAPASKENKASLRRKYEIDEGKFILLHVGTISQGRNLLSILDLQDEKNYQIVIVSTTTFRPDQEICKKLKERGCIVFHQYFANIEEIYQLADCYLFPTLKPCYCIELPLSVLEAMACNIAVVTSRFAALPRIFTEGEGLFYIDNRDDLLSVVKQIENCTFSINTREKVIELTWKKASIELAKLYEGLLHDKSFLIRH